jgi:hypothetical protein
MGELVSIEDWKRVARSKPQVVREQGFYRGFCVTAVTEEEDRARIVLRHDLWTEVNVRLREFDLNRLMLLGCVLADQIIANGGVMPRNLGSGNPTCGAAEKMPDGA